MRCSGLTDTDMSYIADALKANSSIKVLDVSSNRDLGSPTLDALAEVFDHNRTLEYIGLSKLGITTEMIQPVLGLIGRFQFPEDQVEAHLAELKKRDAIIEKNKKLKASKKPEEPVPQLDNIEQITRKNENGEEIQEWVTIKNPQIKHFNLCMNNIDDDIFQSLSDVIERTTDDFGVTLSSNKLSEEVVSKLHHKITALHKGNIELALSQAEQDGAPTEGVQID